MKTANINARIEDWIYSKAKEMNINISEIVRDALISELERRRAEAIMKELDIASAAAKKIGKRMLVKSIRHARDKR
ncbi:MAG: type II toxin-antitoxin system CcdA family antitoxin [Candidatus Micrarchaeota archaeon]